MGVMDVMGPMATATSWHMGRGTCGFWYFDERSRLLMVMYWWMQDKADSGFWVMDANLMAFLSIGSVLALFWRWSQHDCAACMSLADKNACIATVHDSALSILSSEDIWCM